MSSPGPPPNIQNPSAAFTTPTKRATFGSSAEAGPSRARPLGASPAYSSRRHSLYGSRIWKVGFSGEPDPRAVFWAQKDSDGLDGEAWNFDLGCIDGARGNRAEGDRIVGLRMVRNVRETFHKYLMTDSKARKVIVLENTYLPSYVKDHLVRVLFDNLRVPSVSFTPSSLASLAACGRITGLVVDCGWLETTVTPVMFSRPLLHLAKSTTLAGKTLHDRLRLLIHYHATYIVPPASLNEVANRIRHQPVPMSILSDQIIERILSEGCLVGDIPSNSQIEEDDSMEPPVIVRADVDEDEEARLARSLRHKYQSSSSTVEMKSKIPPPTGSPTDMGYGDLLVPGWIRERAAEIFFENETNRDDEAISIPQLILKCLLKLPVDIRATVIQTILVTGGTASLPNFIPRLRDSLLSHLRPSTTSPTPPADIYDLKTWRMRNNEPYKPLYGLHDKLNIINDPLPPTPSTTKAPRWVPSLMSWVGGSLAGALKTGGPEIFREEYDTICAEAMTRAEAWTNAQDEAQVEETAGVELEVLGPGMALIGLEEHRKKGWSEVPRVSDWSRTVPAV
ncbi:hypothetical protein TREMEDRAFT_28085 [Tremella mesenterica DSM 1558]|uniref:uncharacterized protein n=1 Tax=Tremella mesenterica (strain ATCC 24925 / CBS 8224 / DSM 1558 / NBRC 9311 / NRRL Y-6157 / RJB 2259-6 / UBC 559-6) TaxID=578456 RepID=UPI0003F49F74|nr:uncharacterized protein TREMEDRAFT_28085 [Tremella mesenterica DSM 1558]EIW71696.1 hypothetical protein TREMEDRAFT_28085 [Tremella mesenterica DSM 1558]